MLVIVSRRCSGKFENVHDVLPHMMECRFGLYLQLKEVSALVADSAAVLHSIARLGVSSCVLAVFRDAGVMGHGTVIRLTTPSSAI